jgi:RimJ/RimL family protein N-acetyltransferase
LACLNDKHRMRFSNQRFHDHTRESCLAYLGSFEGSPNSYFAIRHGGETVGTISIYRNPHHGTADIGIMTYVGGFGLDAWLAAIALLEAEGVRKITAGTLDCNTRMIAILRASGMHQEGSRFGQELCGGRPANITYWAKFPGQS